MAFLDPNTLEMCRRDMARAAHVEIVKHTTESLGGRMLPIGLRKTSRGSVEIIDGDKSWWLTLGKKRDGWSYYAGVLYTPNGNRYRFWPASS